MLQDRDLPGMHDGIHRSVAEERGIPDLPPDASDQEILAAIEQLAVIREEIVRMSKHLRKRADMVIAGTTENAVPGIRTDLTAPSAGRLSEAVRARLRESDTPVTSSPPTLTEF